jgi:hypothetical protein
VWWKGSAVDNVIALIRLALDRGWPLALLFLLFCGSIILAPWYGVALPLGVTPWAWLGFLFGGSAFVVSMTMHFSRWIEQFLKRRRNRKAERKQAEDQAGDVIANLWTLDTTELSALQELLMNNAPRFQVHTLSAAYNLLPKRILLPTQNINALTYICRLHPAIVERMLLGQLRTFIQ